MIEKTRSGIEISDSQLAAINRYSRRALTKDELFVFSVILCDNEIDRDLERFPMASLEKLAQLYQGKTGVFDHNPKAEHQSARIFETNLEKGGGTNSLGEDYHCLRAWAYMARCEKNRDLILEIDAGIKKEVSVGCAVEKTVCSVCGADQKTGCSHRKGELYQDKPCHHLLLNPTDAYEWSFVAVPAQKGAGVTKGAAKVYTLDRDAVSLEKLFALPGDVSVSKAQLDALGREFASLKAFAAAGEAHYKDLRKEAVRTALLTHPELDPVLMEEIAGGLPPEKLQALITAFGKTAEKAFPIRLQLARNKTSDEEDLSQYTI